jgi:hypothetical protein
MEIKLTPVWTTVDIVERLRDECDHHKRWASHLNAENDRLRGLLREAQPISIDLLTLLTKVADSLPTQSRPTDARQAEATIRRLVQWIERIDAALASHTLHPAPVAAECSVSNAEQPDATLPMHRN